MKPKLELFKEFLSPQLHFLRCPICGESLTIINNSLVCHKKHLFDMSKRGIVLLHRKYQKKIDEIYTKQLFINRREFILEEFYLEVHDYIKTIVNNNGINDSLLDLGSGECSHLRIVKDNNHFTTFGIDLSYDAISLATDYINIGIIPICCDLYNLPFQDKIFDIIINFLSPICSKEASRVLKDDGVIIKVIPTFNYLKELRESLKLNDYQKENEIIANLNKYYNIEDIKRFEYTKNLTEKSRKNLLYMTPMVGHREINMEYMQCLDKITISLDVIILKKKL